ncbi:hypothetical protein EON65_39070 [archaeon]|nr:MAG: hypothetical protein EON65_39070 [archaeon]
MGCINTKAVTDVKPSIAIKWPSTFNILSKLPVDTSVVNNIASELDSDGPPLAEVEKKTQGQLTNRRFLYSIPEDDERDEEEKSYNILSSLFSRFSAGKNDYIGSMKIAKWELEEDAIEMVEDPTDTITV